MPHIGKENAHRARAGAVLSADGPGAQHNRTTDKTQHQPGPDECVVQAILVELSERDPERGDCTPVAACSLATVEGTAAPICNLARKLLALGVAMVEQPLPAWDDGALADMARPLPVCADEACHDTASLRGLAGKYDMINIKLDKTGGLTEALRLKAEAERMGFDVMVGCMLATSLAMAPAVLVAQGADIVDLDGPLLLAADRDNPLKYDADGVHPPTPELWG